MKNKIEKPDWDYSEHIKFEKLSGISAVDDQHWYHLQVRSLSVEGWSSLGVFNQSMIIDLMMNCHDALDQCEQIDSLEKLFARKK